MFGKCKYFKKCKYRDENSPTCKINDERENSFCGKFKEFKRSITSS